jgi:predicted  nucleic acid-binding Zn-ribbon protein
MSHFLLERIDEVANMWFRKKEEDNQLIRLHNNLKMAFNKVNDDINQLKGWTSHLHGRHLEMENMHKSHVSLTQKDIENLNSWIKFLHTNSLELHKYFKEATQNLIELHKRDHDLLEKISALEHEINALKASPPSSVRTWSEPKSEPVLSTRTQFEKRVLEAVRPNRKAYILEQILKVNENGDLSTKQIEKIIVNEKKLCGRTAFYDYLRELRLQKRLRKKVQREI